MLTGNTGGPNPISTLGMEEKLQVIDRLVKIEALEHKMGVGKAGSAFDEEEE